MSAFRISTTFTETLNVLLLKQLADWDAKHIDEPSDMTDQHQHFCDQFCMNFAEMYKRNIPIEDVETFYQDVLKDISVEYDYSDETKDNYEIVLFDNIKWFCCKTYADAYEYLKYAIDEEQELFYYSPMYIAYAVKDEYKKKHRKDITFPEPDLDNDEEDHPLYDTDDCPCCMERFGITEKQELIGNHPTKKILKTTKTICVKRNTYCGHPICLTCFKTICNSSNVSCPMCRKSYEDTGDVEINEYTETLTEEDIMEMIESKDDMLYDMVDYDKMLEQAIYSDGYSGLLHFESIFEADDTYIFGYDIH